ncbi:NAD-dependent epimerase/dehydratase family protein [Acuticoccus mangrovi]|uniref:NAD(P)-dependent oxidoreductase n=1 Tax=Acuticoccus mangrovi TaxID=2796142 RepID=A0A934MFB8_9HYPH|nr:NAD(P)-dependent oxidoreductase [Acuticoccus mangrovi]MBJ3778497.1 NAD(P)-dependent oxidoreductase [Acuticoccus mangrovi]
MRVLVFGAAGFVGRRLVAALAGSGVDVVGADIAAAPAGAAPCPIHAVDVGDRDAVAGLTADVRPDVVVNLAYATGAAIEANLDRSTRINLGGHVHVLDAAIASRARRVVYSSSIAAYGPDQALYGDRDIVESDSCPLEHHGTTYGAMKAFNDFVAARYRARGLVETCGVRLSIVFGPGRRHGFTAWTSRMLDPPSGEGVPVPLAAEQALSLISVEDAARLLALAVGASGALPPLVNSGGHRASAKGVADMVVQIEPRARFTFEDHPAEMPFVDRLSGDLAREALGFRPQPFAAALRAEMARAADGATS